MERVDFVKLLTVLGIGQKINGFVPDAQTITTHSQEEKIWIFYHTRNEFL
jgi:hypothetical protein